MMGISGISPYGGLAKVSPYQSYVQRYQGAQNTQAAEQASKAAEGGMKLQLSGTPKAPIQPVNPIGAPTPHTPEGVDVAQKLRQGADPAELAVRMRIQYEDPAQQPTQAAGKPIEDEPAVGAESAQKAAEEGQCQTCKERKYQDGSNDPGVSFKVPSRIAPEMAGAAVRGHEMEHVVREQAKAQREGRRVINQSVTIHTAICPECGKPYISGGTTRTTTASQPAQAEPERKGESFSAVA